MPDNQTKPAAAVEPPPVLVISSHVVRGTVGNRAAVFALETLGHPVWALPTVVLPWHPGQGRSTRLSFASDAFDSAVNDLAHAPIASELRAVLTGYFGDAEQVRSVARLVRHLRLANPDLFFVCDPVIGDKEGLYIPEATAIAIREELLPLASLATPNQYELAWFAGRELHDNAELQAAAQMLGPAKVLVTSAFAMMANSVGNLLVSGDKAILCEHRMVDNPPNGPGDLMSALMLSRLLAGLDDERALQMASSSVFEILVRTHKRGENELALGRESASLSTPMAMVQMRQLVARKALI